MPPVYLPSSTPGLTQSSGPFVQIAGYDPCYSVSQISTLPSGASVSTVPSAVVLSSVGANCTPGFVLSPGAHIYTVSAINGSDSNTGLDILHPFQTISKAASVMQPGDVCVVRAGTYRETVTPATSGTASAPIRFVAATFENPVVSGADVIAGWSAATGFPSPNAVQATIGWQAQQVFVNSRMINLARFPKAASLNQLAPIWTPINVNSTPDPVTGNYTVSAPALTQTAGFWNGSTLWVVGGGRNIAGTASVISSTPGQLIVSNTTSSTWSWNLGAGSAVVYGSPQALNGPSEWYYASNVLALSEHAASDLVEVKHRTYAFDLGTNSYIQIKGFQIFAASANLGTAQNSVIDNCSFSYVMHFDQILADGFSHDTLVNSASIGLGVQIGGQNNIMKNSQIAYSAGDGISVYGNFNRVTNCIVHDVDYIGIDSAAIAAEGVGHSIDHNTIYNTGRNTLVHRHLVQGTITENHIYSAGILTMDLGLTYTYSTNGACTTLGGAPATGDGGCTTMGGVTRLSYNWLHDNFANSTRFAGGGNGVYLDNSTENITADHNVIWDIIDDSVDLNWGDTNLLVYNNTVSTTWAGIIDNNVAGSGMQIYNNLVMSVNLAAGVNSPSTLTSDTVFAPSSSATYFTNATNFNFTLAQGSPAINAGVVIPGITDGYVGSAPDIGAYEFGATPWIPGATLTGGNMPPVVNLVSPMDNLSFVPADQPTLIANALDPDGNITAVQFLANDNPIGSGTLINGQWKLPLNLPSGQYVFTAQATDNLGAVSTSNPIRIYIGNRLATQPINGETYNNKSVGGALNGNIMGSLDNGTYLEYDDVDFGMGVSTFTAHIGAPAATGNTIEVHVDSLTGPIIANLPVTNTGGYDDLNLEQIGLTTAGLSTHGVHSLYLIFRGGSGVCNLDYVQFH